MSYMFQYQSNAYFKNQKEVDDTYDWLMDGLDKMHERHKNNNVVKFKRKSK